MTTSIKQGQRNWSGSRDTDGHRTYKVTFLIASDDAFDGPATVLATPGLPRPGESWAIDNDLDLWAHCTLEATATPLTIKEPNFWWEAEYTFTTKPWGKLCKDIQIDDPLLVADRLSGGFTKYTEEATQDRFGNPLRNSAWEILRGPQVEFDHSRPTIKIEQNRLNLELPLLASFLDCVNDAPLWGLPPRCIKLSNVTWEKKFYGLCYSYFQRTLEFECRYDTFDRILLDEGTKVLSGKWDTTSGSRNRWVVDEVDEAGDLADFTNPQDFIHAIDKHGNPCRILLDGRGQPASQTNVTGHYVSIQPGNVGHALTLTSWWVAIVGSVEPQPWEATTNYNGGELVTDAGVTYVATGASFNFEPPNASWFSLGVNLQYVGNYSGTTTYNLGDVVQSTTTSTPAALYVQKYSPANFLLLGIPVTF